MNVNWKVFGRKQSWHNGDFRRFEENHERPVRIVFAPAEIQSKHLEHTKALLLHQPNSVALCSVWNSTRCTMS
jgi:hypothetical protein